MGNCGWLIHGWLIGELVVGFTWSVGNKLWLVDRFGLVDGYSMGWLVCSKGFVE